MYQYKKIYLLKRYNIIIDFLKYLKLISILIWNINQNVSISGKYKVVLMKFPVINCIELALYT